MSFYFRGAYVCKCRRSLEFVVSISHFSVNECTWVRGGNEKFQNSSKVEGERACPDEESITRRMQPIS